MTDTQEVEREDGQVNPPYVDTSVPILGPLSKTQVKAIVPGILGFIGLLNVTGPLWWLSLLCTLEGPIGLWYVARTGWSRTPIENAKVTRKKYRRKRNPVWRDTSANWHSITGVSTLQNERSANTTENVAGREVTRE